MRKIALDVGDVRIGIAVSDPLGITAQGLTVIERVGIRKDCDKIMDLIKEYECDAVVIGLNKRLDGSDTPQTEKVYEFKRMLENNIKPEYECFEMGHLDTILTMAKKGLVPGAPMQFNFVLGVPGCTPATVQNLAWLVNNIPAGSTWTATGIGRYAFQLAAPAIVMGGHVRVGFEDNLYLERGVLAKSNGELVAKVVRLAKELGREVATSAEAREILGLKAK